MRTLLVAVVLVALSAASAQTLGDGSLSNQLQALQVQTALLFPSSAVDEFPVWSPDSRFLAANVQGKWLKLDTSAIQLQKAKWHDRPIAAIKNDQKFTEVAPAEIAEWLKGAKEHVRIVSRSGITVELSHHELSTSLVLSKGKERKTLWKSDLENCGELQRSPNGLYAAYICEMNGVIVMDIDAAFVGN